MIKTYLNKHIKKAQIRKVKNAKTQQKLIAKEKGEKDEKKVTLEKKSSSLRASDIQKYCKEQNAPGRT